MSAPEFDLENLFSYHPPLDSQIPKYGHIRSVGKQFAEEILRLTPKSREQTIAINKIREAVMWANAAIACNENESEAGSLRTS